MELPKSQSLPNSHHRMSSQIYQTEFKPKETLTKFICIQNIETSVIIMVWLAEFHSRLYKMYILIT